jgi:hypothetical protein
MRKEGFKLGLNEIIALFKPGSAQNDDLLGPANEDGDSVDDKGRRAAGMIKRRPGRPRKEESSVYGRRW